MTVNQFQRAFAIADGRDFRGNRADLDEDTSIFDGYGLRGFQPVVATVQQLAALMRKQALFDGTWNMEELNDLRNTLRRTVTILN